MEPDLTRVARAHLSALVDLAWGDGGASAVRAYLRKRLATAGAVPYGPRTRDRDDGPLVGLLPAIEPDRRPLVLTARTDLSGASALASVAAVLTAVPGLMAAGLERAVIVALCDEARDDGMAHWFDHVRRHDVKAALTVGRLVPGPSVDGDDVLEVAGVETDARLPQVLDAAPHPGVRPWPTRHVEDGLPFARHGVPYLRLGAPALGPARGARIDVTGGARLAARAAGWTVALARELDGARLPGPYAGYDSTSYEVDAATRSLGPVLAALGGPPTGRADLDRLAARLYEA
ncbi:MAG: hypothetical protein ABR510_10775 [Trueperaceae bacterium]